MQGKQRTVEASKPEPARHAPATAWLARLAAMIGVTTIGVRIALLIAVALEQDRDAGARIMWVALTGVVLGFTWRASQIGLFTYTRAVRQAYRLGRLSAMVERAAVRSPSSRQRGRTPAGRAPSAPTPRIAGASAGRSNR